MAKEKIVVQKKEKVKKNKKNKIENPTNGTEVDAFLSNQKTQKSENKFKKFFYGVGKEFERTSWTTKSKLISDFFVVIIIVVILAAIFTGIGILMATYVK